jgi:uncharacterized Zn-binding protein involved in type VI secretion
MSPLLRRAATFAGLAVCGWSTLLPAQSTSVAVPDRAQIRRALPVAPAEAPPIVQQSPNGLYKLSITDTGIELRGPRGSVTINDAGIKIGGPGTLQVTIETGNMDARIDRDLTYRVGQNLKLDASSNVQIRGQGTTDISAAGGASLTGSRVSLGCSNGGKPAARLGDQVNTSTGPAAMIAQGSPTVLIC